MPQNKESHLINLLTDDFRHDTIMDMIKYSFANGVQTCCCCACQKGAGESVG